LARALLYVSNIGERLCPEREKAGVQTCVKSSALGSCCDSRAGRERRVALRFRATVPRDWGNARATTTPAGVPNASRSSENVCPGIGRKCQIGNGDVTLAQQDAEKVGGRVLKGGEDWRG
jgi:hypothetical protein